MATGFNGKTPPTVLPAIGSFIPLIPFLATPANAATMDIVFPQLKTIRGVIIQVQDSGNNIVNGDAEAAVFADVTFSGNVLTIADGTDFDLSAFTAGRIFGLVWGDAKL
jgi:hypothetical protein